LQQADIELNKLMHLADRLKIDLPRVQYEQWQTAIQYRRQSLQTLTQKCQQARNEHEQHLKMQNKFQQELIGTHEWLQRLVHDLAQAFDLNFSLNNVNDLRNALTVSEFSMTLIIMNAYVR
jgi:uncharacterized HAD superfamily protein